MNFAHSLRDLLQLSGGGIAKGVQGGKNPKLQSAPSVGRMLQSAPSRGVQRSAPAGAMQGMGAIGGSIAIPQQALHSIVGRNVMGGSPQGFPGVESQYPQPNFQQPQPLDIQSVQNPGLIPLQGSQGVPNIQNKRRGGQISF